MNHFNYTNVPEQLLYRRRKNLDEFGVDNIPSLDYFIHEQLLDRYSRFCDYEEFACDLFNCAYYLCTLALADSHPERRLGFIILRVHERMRYNDEYGGVIISIMLLQMWARRWDMSSHKLSNLFRKLSDELQKKEYADLFESFFCRITQEIQSQKLEETLEHSLENEFERCEITLHQLYEVNGEWNFASHLGTDSDKVWEFVKAIGKNEKEQQTIVDYLRDEMHSSFEKGYEHKYFFESLDGKIHRLYHGKEDDEKLNQEIWAQQEEEYMHQMEFDFYKSEHKRLSDENTRLLAEVEQLKTSANTTLDVKETVDVAIDSNTQQDTDDEFSKLLAEKDAIINEQNERIADYAAKYDPEDIRKKKVVAMTGKQHAILLLAFLAHHDRLPHARTNLSLLLCFIASRNESTMHDYLKGRFTQDECETLAKVFDADCPFIAKIIRELPEKLEKDKSEKNGAGVIFRG